MGYVIMFSFNLQSEMGRWAVSVHFGNVCMFHFDQSMSDIEFGLGEK